MLEIEYCEDACSVLLNWSLRGKFTFSNLTFYNVCFILSIRTKLCGVQGELYYKGSIILEIIECNSLRN